MSYILEALRKSEQERARGGGQDLLQLPSAPPPAASLRPGVVLGLSALLLAGGIAIGWWQPWQRPSQPSPRPAALPPQERIASAPVREPAAVALPAPAEPVAPTRADALRELRPLMPEGSGPGASGAAAIPSSSPTATAERAAVGAKPPAPAPRPVVEAAPAQLAPRRTPEVAAPAPRPAAEAAATPGAPPRPAAEADPKPEERKASAKPPPPKELPPPPNRVLSLSELPQSLREALPPLSIRGYVHSEDPASRLVVVNDRMLHEGDEVAADLKLERIDPEGMVLNFRGYRFVAPR